MKYHQFLFTSSSRFLIICVIFGLSALLIGACGSGSGNDDDDDSTNTDTTTAAEVSLTSTTLSCVADCEISTSDPTAASISDFQGTWETALGSRLEFTGVKGSVGSFTFTDYQGGVGEGSFTVLNGLISLNITTSDSLINLLEVGIRTLQISSINPADGITLSLLETPEAEAVETVILSCAADVTCDTSTFEGTWETTVSETALIFVVDSAGNFTFSTTAGSGSGSFTLAGSVGTFNFTESTVPEVISAPGSVQFTITVDGSQLTLAHVEGSTQFTPSESDQTLYCLNYEIGEVGEDDLAEITYTCGREEGPEFGNVFNATVDDLVGQWLFEDLDNTTLVVETAGEFSLVETKITVEDTETTVEESTATGTYTVSEGVVTLTISTSDSESWPVGELQWPLTSVERNELVLSLDDQ